MLKQTQLYRAHLEMGAKMVDFGGWEMPLHYGSQIEEHHRVRRDAGMFDVSHMLVADVAGAGARDYLRRLLANDVAKLESPGQALYSCVLNEGGGIIDDLIVYFLEPTRFRMVVNAATAEKDLSWMQQQKQQSGLMLEIMPRRDLAMIAVQGPNSREKLGQALPALRHAVAALKPFSAIEVNAYFVACTGYTGEDGFEIMLPTDAAEGLWRALAAAGVAPIGLGARDTLRLEAGMNLYGQDMDESTTPLEAGLGWTVDFSPARDFIGKEALSAKPPARQLLGLTLQDKGVLRSHQKVVTPFGAGEISSGSFSPSLNCSIAFAFLPVQVVVGEVVQVEIRGKLLQAKVVKPPFVRHGKSLI